MDPSTVSVLDLLDRYRITGRAERQYQDSIEEILVANKVSHVREAALSPADRIDFLIDGGVGIEVKVQGSRAAVIRQLARYAESDQVNSLIVAATTRRLMAVLPDEILGVPVSRHLLQGGLR